MAVIQFQLMSEEVDLVHESSHQNIALLKVPYLLFLSHKIVRDTVYIIRLRNLPPRNYFPFWNLAWHVHLAMSFGMFVFLF